MLCLVSLENFLFKDFLPFNKGTKKNFNFSSERYGSFTCELIYLKHLHSLVFGK